MRRQPSNLRLVEAPSEADSQPGELPGAAAVASAELSGGATGGAVAGSRRKRAKLEALSDEELVILAAAGDAGACGSLYYRHAAFAFNLAARIAGSTNDVEDVVHDAFLKAFDSLSSLNNRKAFRSWLGSIVVHGMRSRLRRARLLRLFGLGRGSDPVDLACVASDEASPATRAQLAQIYALLQTMAPDDRIAWTLRFVDGHDLKAAAELCDCSLATIKRRIRRAKLYLESHFVTDPAPGHGAGEEEPGRPRLKVVGKDKPS